MHDIGFDFGNESLYHAPSHEFLFIISSLCFPYIVIFVLRDGLALCERDGRYQFNITFWF